MGEATKLEAEFLREQPDYDATINPTTGLPLDLRPTTM